MTTDNTTDAESKTMEMPEVVEPVLDLHLRLLVKMLNDDETNRSYFGISLNIPGGVIYGHAISHDAYLDDWESTVREANGNGVDFVATLPRKLSEFLDEEMKDVAQDPLPRMIHLRNATFLTGAPIQTMEYRLWRGRIADVAGWSLSMPS